MLHVSSPVTLLAMKGLAQFRITAVCDDIDPYRMLVQIPLWNVRVIGDALTMGMAQFHRKPL